VIFAFAEKKKGKSFIFAPNFLSRDTLKGGDEDDGDEDDGDAFDIHARAAFEENNGLAADLDGKKIPKEV